MDNIKLGGLFYPTVDQAGNTIPFDSLFIPYIYKEIYFEGVYIDVLNQQTDMTILDVGANIGVTVDHFRNYAKKVYAIEPSPEHFAALKQNKEFNNWDNVSIHNVALADKGGEMQFSQNSNNRTMNSLMIGEKTGDHTHEVKDQYIKAMINAPGYNTQITVPTVAIDTFFEQNNIEKVDFCKMDPEGAENMIIRSEGFKKVAPKIQSMMCEFHFPDWRELADYICTFGYTARIYQSSAIVVLFSR